MKPIKELSLFTGIGCGILGTSLVNTIPVCSVEIDDYCNLVLKQRQEDGVLPRFPMFKDIKTFNGVVWRDKVDLVSGGFPCQAFSSASHGRIVAEDLSGQMLRIVGETKTPLVFAENVNKRIINEVCDKLESMGYHTKGICLGAKDLGADHIRTRYWLLAYSDGYGKLLCKEYAKASGSKKLQTCLWESNPREPRVAYGASSRVERLRATGNGQVPIVAATAFHILMLESA